MGILAGKLEKYLPAGAAKREKVGGTLAKLKGVHELLADTLEATEKLDIVDALRAASPWAEAVGSALGDAVPPVRFVLKLFEGLTKIDDPGELGYLAATLAYQRAVEQAWAAMAPEIREKLRGADPQMRKKALAELRSATPAEGYDFSKFSFEKALKSPFVADAESFLEMSTRGLGLDEADFRVLQWEVRHRFVPNLKGILSHGSTREKFGPFRESLSLDSLEARASDALLEHADFQRWLFEEQKVLGHEPFTLAQVYTDLDCGVLRWREIHEKVDREGQPNVPIDPFREEHGSRHPLIETLLELIADSKFRDAIVIQGVAGSGKSSSTLRLAWELVRQGLRPIRIELKHLDARDSAAIDVALPEAVHITSRDRDANSTSLVFGKDLFRGGEIFQESVHFRGTRICPYVLILDGWDEISVSASEGYHQRVERMLDGVRRKYIEHQGLPIRVILAGRPSHAIQDSKFLRNETRVLTVRDFSPDQLESYVKKVKKATSAADRRRASSWSLAKVAALPQLIENYREAYEFKAHHGGGGSLEIFGLPLLSHLALRLLAERPDDAEEMLEDRTSLYRNLVDLVVGQGGKPVEADVEGSAMIKGKRLRELLWGTAEAMTTFGAEAIPYEELALRLDLEDTEMRRQAEQLAGDHVLSRLMISFFFRGGYKELGAEFSHKSFREYLFAEQVVAVLKSYGRKASDHLPERPIVDYWKDFDPTDPRRNLCHRLAELLGPVWLTPEVALHVHSLLVWEIGRTGESKPSLATPSLSQQDWRRVRDGLADAWDWWGEGVHLRPQPGRNKQSGLWQYEHGEPPVALQVVENKRLRSDLKQCPQPPRMTTIDAHLGDGLCLLAAVVHATVASQGWRFEGEVPRRCQSSEHPQLPGCLVFKPTGSDSAFFVNFCARINAGGYRPAGPFPTDLFFSRADLSWVDLSRANFSWADLSRADLSRADLTGAHLLGADLSGIEFDLTNLSGANLSGADLSGANLSRANLVEANLVEANLSGANLTEAYLLGADLRGANLQGADFNGANLSEARLSESFRSQLSAEQIRFVIFDEAFTRPIARDPDL